MTLVSKKNCLIQKNLTSKALTDPLSHKSDQNQDHTDALGLNKPLVRLFKAFVQPSQDLSPKTSNIA